MKSIEEISTRTNIIIVDFHAQTTSEKEALGWYLDGKVSAVIGTHTRVQTADERILPCGTAYITDVGMTGALNSVTGVKKEQFIEYFLTGIYGKFDPEDGDAVLNAVIIDIDDTTGRSKSIATIQRKLAL